MLQASMSDTVKVRFTAKPGLYPDHKGGRTWLHERAGPKTVLYGETPTVKVFPKVVIQSGETFEVEASMAATLVARHPGAFEIVSDSKPKAGKFSKSPTTEADI